VRLRKLIPPILLTAAALAFSLFRDSMRRGRISAWLHPEAHAGGAALQAQQAMYGLGSGGWFGVGLGNGMQKHGYLPEIQTDFIFANIGEELGLVATLLVVLAFVVLAICGIFIALNARDAFGALLAAGITFLISLQAAINIGVVTSALPNKGLPLPFISYGGSNLIAMLACVGILFSIARHAPVREKISKTSAADENPFAARAT
jgi:cell division protein FtsW